MCAHSPQIARTVMYVNAIYAQMAGSDPTHDQVDGILDSGNNKHHCFQTQPIAFLAPPVTPAEARSSQRFLPYATLP